MASMLEYILEHKDYPSSIGYGDDNGVLHGRLGFIRALVIHEGDDDKHLKAAFQEALDDSLTDSRPINTSLICRKKQFQRAPRQRPAPTRDALRQATGDQPPHRRQRCAAVRARTRRACGFRLTVPRDLDGP